MTVAEILHMAEMIFLTYAVGYLQVYVLWNFDESDEISKKELLGIIICTIIYTAVSYIGKWFDRNSYVTLGFAAYIVFVYMCLSGYINAGARIDDKILNSDLKLFKQGQIINSAT